MISIGVTILVIAMMFFVLSTKDKKQNAVEKSRALSFEKISISVLKKNAQSDLSESERVYFSELELHRVDDSLQIVNFKELSKEWFGRDNWILAGHYAEEVARLEETGESWGIAANTYVLGMQRYEEVDMIEFSKKKAIENYEKAISTAPNEVEYKVNLAVCYAEKPDQDNPMKGVLMLLDLDKKNPNEPQVLNTLAYYGLQTGQVDKAEQRLKKVLELDENNQRAICLMARLLRAKGENDKAVVFQARCSN